MAELPSPQPKISIPTLITPIVALSVLLGAAAGGVTGYVVVHQQHPTGNVNSGQATALSVKEDSATVDVVKETLPAVVTVVATKDLSKVQQPLSPFDQFFGIQTPSGPQEIGQGAGFIVDANGLIVTNKHVISDDQAQYSVVLSDGRSFDAEVKAKDPSNDVAILKIDATDLPTLTLGDSDPVSIGQTVIAIGNPLRFTSTVTKGIISGKSRTITASDGSGQAETLEDVFQTDAAINPGNSGGPLIDLTGHAIAVNTAVSQQGQLIGFAIPINVIKNDLTSFSQQGKIVRPLLGVRYVPITKDLASQEKLPVDQGAYIQPGQNNEPAVLSDSPASQAGIKEGDIITKVNGDAITEEHSLAGLLTKYAPGDTITLTVLRDGKTSEIKVTLTQRDQ